MPALFIGHGSPMNGIEDTEFSRRWTNMAKEIPTPKAVLVVSAQGIFHISIPLVRIFRIVLI